MRGVIERLYTLFGVDRCTRCRHIAKLRQGLYLRTASYDLRFVCNACASMARKQETPS